MDTWNDFIAIAGSKLPDVLQTIYSITLGLNADATAAFLEDCMSDHLGVPQSPYEFRPVDMGVTREHHTGKGNPRSRLTFAPYQKDTTTEHFAVWEHVAYLQNRPLVTVSVESAGTRPLTGTCTLVGFDTFNTGIQSVRSTFRNTETYAQRFWNREVVPHVDGLATNVECLGQDRLKKLLWNAHLLQQYAATPIRESLQPNADPALVNILDAAVLERIVKSRAGIPAEGPGWTVGGQAKHIELNGAGESFAMYRPKLKLWSAEGEAEFYKELQRRSGPWTSYVLDVIQNGVVPLLKQYVAEAEFPPILASLYVYAKVVDSGERWVTLVGSDELLGRILPGSQPFLLPYGPERSSLADIRAAIDAFRENNPRKPIAISYNIAAEGLAGFPVAPKVALIKPKSLLARLKSDSAQKG